MPRVYKPKDGAKTYRKHSSAKIKAAIADVEKGMTYRKAAMKHNISFTVLYRHKTQNIKKQGGQPVLSESEEMEIMQRLIQCADWGYPVESFDLRTIVKSFLDHSGRKESRFKDNMPGREWAYSYLKRHKNEISERMCQNIKRARAKVSPEVIEQYFEFVAKELEGVPPSNIINYDETNLSDDPGKKKVITKRGCKYPERVMNHSKSCTSLMFAGTADGAVLPWYVVYKAKNLYNTWTENGPKRCRYNRSNSGWFDMTCFEDWVRTVVIPFCSKLQGRKVLIGDNLSSHLSCEMIRLSKEHDISFVFLPPNSTHLTQPLDIAFFRPMKIKWRQILTNWKRGLVETHVASRRTVFLACYPSCTLKLTRIHQTTSKSGFRKAGLFPLNKNEVLKMIPKANDQKQQDQTVNLVTDAFVEYLKSMRYGDQEETVRKRKKKVNVDAGKSVAVEDFENAAVENLDIDYIGSEDDAADNDDGDNDDRDTMDVPKETALFIPDAGSHENLAVNFTDPVLQSVSSDANIIANIESFNDIEFEMDERITEVVNEETGENVAVQSVETGSWLIVHFSKNDSRKKNAKKLAGSNYIGLVEDVSTDGVFTGKFVRPKATREFSGFVYGFPNVPDESSFTFEQIQKVLQPPERYGRGYLKFEVHANEL